MLEVAGHVCALAGQQQQYVLTSSGLLEVNRVKHAACSWLVEQQFVSGAPQLLQQGPYYWQAGRPKPQPTSSSQSCLLSPPSAESLSVQHALTTV
jgi:hypothetical protein